MAPLSSPFYFVMMSHLQEIAKNPGAFAVAAAPAAAAAPAKKEEPKKVEKKKTTSEEGDMGFGLFD